MRVLAVCLPSPGHVNPLLPLLGALVDQGDEVIVATGDDVRETVVACGAQHASAGSGIDTWFGRLAERIRGMPGDGLPPERIGAYFIPRLFGEVAVADMVDDVIAVGRRLQPHCVVYETEAFAGPAAAAALGVPLVHHQVGPLPDAEVTGLVLDALTPLWADLGVAIDRSRSLNGQLLVRTMPTGLESAPPPPVESIALRPAPLPRPAGDGEPRLVHLTFGTVLNNDLGLLRDLACALAAAGHDVLVTVGPTNEPSVLGAVPPGVTVERYVAHADLLPRCRAVVHHGGAGTMLSSAAHGLPQVILPQGADQFLNGAAVAGAGAGIALDPASATPADVVAAVATTLQDPSYDERARALAAEIAAMPEPAEVAAAIRALFADPAG